MSSISKKGEIVTNDNEYKDSYVIIFEGIKEAEEAEHQFPEEGCKFFIHGAYYGTRSDNGYYARILLLPSRQNGASKVTDRVQ